MNRTNRLVDIKSRSNSHRESVTSIKSINSEDDLSRNKIILDEAVNPKRPLRPNRQYTHNSTSSPSNSNQSSRPISHLSGDELSSNNSMQQLSFKIADSLLMMQEDGNKTLMNPPQAPPPKPPKPANVSLVKLPANVILSTEADIGTSNLSRSAHTTPKKQTNQNGNGHSETTNKSTTSLNNKGVQFRNFNTIKTASDSLLNRVFLSYYVLSLYSEGIFHFTFVMRLYLYRLLRYV